MLETYTLFKTIEALVCAFILATAHLVFVLIITILICLFFYTGLDLLSAFMGNIKSFFILFYIIALVKVIFDDEFYKDDFEI